MFEKKVFSCTFAQNRTVMENAGVSKREMFVGRTRQDKTRYISDRTGYGFRNTFIYIYM